jgi:hypothetical protein
VKYTPDSGGFGTGKQGGQIVQPSLNGPIVRQAPRQKQRAAPPPYLGSLFIPPTGRSYARWNRQRLRFLSDVWADTLTGGQRSAWDGIAPGALNGFDTFQLINKMAGPCFGDYDNPEAHTDDLPFTDAPASYTPPATPVIIQAVIARPFYLGYPYAAIQINAVTLPMRFRAAVRSEQSGSYTKPRPSWLAIASGDVQQQAQDDFTATAYFLTEWLPNTLSNPQTVHVQYGLSSNDGTFSFINGPVTIENAALTPWLTIVAGRGFLQNGTQALNPDPAITTNPLRFDLVMDKTVNPPPAAHNAPNILQDVGPLGANILSQSFTTPSSGPFLPGDREAYSQPFVVLTMIRNLKYTYVQFGTQYGRVLGGPFYNQRYWYRLFLVDPTLGTPSSPADVSTATI